MVYDPQLKYQRADHTHPPRPEKLAMHHAKKHPQILFADASFGLAQGIFPYSTITLILRLPSLLCSRR
jgi:hypothetical protein